MTSVRLQVAVSNPSNPNPTRYQMNNIVTKIINEVSKVEFVLDTTSTRAEQYLQAVAAGVDLSRSSFLAIVNGRQEVVKGWRLTKGEPKIDRAPSPKTVQVIARFQHVREEGELADVITGLEAKGFKMVKVRKDERQVAMVVPGEVKPTLHSPQVKINILKTGGYSVRYSEEGKATGINSRLSSTVSSKDIVRTVGMIVSQAHE